MTPHQSSQKFGTENLTPTFRNPDIFLAETKEVLKSLTPVKLFPIPSETQPKQNFIIIPPCHIEKDDEIGRDFSNLNNIQSMLIEHNCEEKSFSETRFPECEEPSNEINKTNETINCDNSAFTIQIEVEHNSSLEKNEKCSSSELMSVINNDIFETADQNSAPETKTINKIEISTNDSVVNEGQYYLVVNNIYFTTNKLINYLN